MTELTGQLRAAVWWLVPLVLLALVIGWETGWGKAFVRHPAPAEPIAPKPVAASVLPEYTIPGGASAHTDMVQRTLFNPTRRPAPPVPEVAASKMQRGQFALTGTLVIDGKSTAFLKELQGNRSRRVLAGDNLNGMLVAEVKPDRVRLSLGDESEELFLKVGTNPRATVQPAVPAVAAAPAAVPGQPVAVPGAQPVAPPAEATAVAPAAEATQTLAERRRAARAAALEQQQQVQGNQPAPTPAPAPTGSPAPGTVDPRWNQLEAYGARGGRVPTSR
jgi:hypothetical protein